MREETESVADELRSQGLQPKVTVDGGPELEPGGNGGCVWKGL